MTRRSDMGPERPLKLYDFPSSPNCLKVRAVAYELDLRLELTTVNIFRGETEAPGFRALNPNGLVPVLVERDFVLWESNAIITYLAATHPTPSLLSTDARERADVDRWLQWQCAHLSPAISRIAFERTVKPTTGRATDAPAAASARRDLARHCATLEASLADAEYIAKRLTVADFAVACVLHTSEMVGLDLRAFRRTSAWLQRMLARDSLQRALADARESLHAMYGCTAGRRDDDARRSSTRRDEISRPASSYRSEDPQGEMQMADILHRVGIKASLNDVYKALTTVEGLSGWWATNTQGDGKVGGVLQFRFGAGGFDMKVLELAPGKSVLWQVVDGPAEWIGTKVHWDLKQDGDYTMVLFKHEGWKEPVEFMYHCSTKWAIFLMSLKSLVETGKGAPDPNDVKIDNFN